MKRRSCWWSVGRVDELEEKLQEAHDYTEAQQRLMEYFQVHNVLCAQAHITVPCFFINGIERLKLCSHDYLMLTGLCAYTWTSPLAGGIFKNYQLECWASEPFLCRLLGVLINKEICLSFLLICITSGMQPIYEEERWKWRKKQTRPFNASCPVACFQSKAQ